MIYEHTIVNHISLQPLFNYRADFLGSIVVFFYCTYKYDIMIRGKISYKYIVIVKILLKKKKQF